MGFQLFSQILYIVLQRKLDFLQLLLSCEENHALENDQMNGK